MSSNAPDRLKLTASFRRELDGVLAVQSYAWDETGACTLRGALLLAPDAAYATLTPRIEAVGYTPYLRPAEGGLFDIRMTPGVAPKPQPINLNINPRTALWLFVATVVSVIVTGSLRWDATGAVSFHPLDGLMFAGSLLSILVAHEAGHYIVGRIRGVKTSLPLFLPLPIISLGGTLGAVILQGEPFKDRKTLLEVGIAGPLAGFVLAVPLFVLGVYLTDRTPITVIAGSSFLGDSLLTRLIGETLIGTLYTSTTQSVIVHPIGFGAWIGLLITGINLIPAGQLDGGHIAYALLGPRARYLTWGVLAVMLAMAIWISEAWLVWVILLYFFGRQHPPVTYPDRPLGAAHVLLAVAGVIVLLLTFVPAPIFQV
jgi:membrane-associated protease RseP (regulator of RpoE activity)